MASRGQVSALSSSASAAFAHTKTLSTSAAAVMESLFQKSLQDLVKGLRAQNIGEALYLAQALKDIRKEMKSKDVLTKALAVQKLTYIHMLQSSDMAWASFPVIEVMSSPKFGWKQIGYLAACQSFNDDTDVLLLTTNLVRKDLASANQVEAALALNFIATVANADLARDLAPDVFTLLNSGRPLVRKRATLVLLRLVEKYPDSLTIVFKWLVKRLDDNETGVVASAVNVLCQLAAQDPPQFLPLAPDFFRLLNSSTNTWLRIKVVKLFGLLAPLEPRLAKKLSDPLCEILRSTPAKSLQFEIIKTVTGGMPQQTTAVSYCILRLGEFIQESDPNLCYLSLKALSSLLPSHSKAISELKGPVVACLGNADPGIQHLALKVLTGVVTRSSLIPTVRVLEHLLGEAGDDFRDGLVRAILEMGGGGLYERVEDFEWYAEVVFGFATVPGMREGAEVARQIVDLAVRVGEMRPNLVLHAHRLVLHSTRLGSTDSESVHPALASALGASAWILGEFYPSETQGPRHAALNPRDVIGGLVQVSAQELPPAVMAVYLQAVMKVLLTAVSDLVGEEGGREEGGTKEGEEVTGVEYGGRLLLYSDKSGGGETGGVGIDPKEGEEEIGGEGMGSERVGGEARVLLDLVRDNTAGLTRSCHMAVQEGACELMALVDILSNRPEKISRVVVRSLKIIFEEELPPVAVGAQKRVPLSPGLILPENFGEIEAEMDALLLPDEPGMSGQQEGGVGDGISVVSPSGWGPLVDKGEVGGTSFTSLEEHREKYSPFYLPTNKEAPNEGIITEVVDEIGIVDRKAIFEDSKWRDRKQKGVSRMEVRREEEDLPPLPQESVDGERENGVREDGVVPVKKHRRKKEAISEGASGSKKPHRRKEGRGELKEGEVRKSRRDVKKIAPLPEDLSVAPLLL